VAPRLGLAGHVPCRSARTGRPITTRAARWAAREAVKLGAREGRLLCGAPVLPDRAAVERSGLSSQCRAMNRRATDLPARRDRTWAAGARPTDDSATMRMRGGGGGRDEDRGGRPESRCRGRRTKGCLAQRRELERRSDGVAQALGERALESAGRRQQGEHVFVKVGLGSDGTMCRGHPPRERFGSGAPIRAAHSASRLATRRRPERVRTGEREATRPCSARASRGGSARPRWGHGVELRPGLGP
jgi:hypothetical protein